MNETTSIFLTLIGGGTVGVIVSAIFQFFNANKTSANSLLTIAHGRIEEQEETIKELKLAYDLERNEKHKIQEEFHRYKMSNPPKEEN